MSQEEINWPWAGVLQIERRAVERHSATCPRSSLLTSCSSSHPPGSTAGEGASTISQATPVVPPPSSAVSNPFPTATAQDPAFISSLAAAGAQAAFSSRGGQTLSLGASGAGLTSLPGTSPSAGQAPTAISSAAGNAAGNANRNAAPRSSNSQGGAALALLLAGACAGAAYLL